VSLLYFVVPVWCRRYESSRSLSHLLMSFLSRLLSVCGNVSMSSLLPASKSVCIGDRRRLRSASPGWQPPAEKSDINRTANSFFILHCGTVCHLLYAWQWPLTDATFERRLNASLFRQFTYLLTYLVRNTLRRRCGVSVILAPSTKCLQNLLAYLLTTDRRGFTMGQGAGNLSVAPKCFGYSSNMQY